MRAYLSPTDNSTKFNEIWASRIQEHAEDKRKSWIVQGVPAYYGKNNVRKDFVCCMLYVDTNVYMVSQNQYFERYLDTLYAGLRYL